MLHWSRGLMDCKTEPHKYDFCTWKLHFFTLAYTNIISCYCSPSLQVFGGLVWILVASNHIVPENPMAWVMFVSVFCFVMTFLWMIIFGAGCHRNSSSWAAAVRPHSGANWLKLENARNNVMKSNKYGVQFTSVIFHFEVRFLICVYPGLCLSRAGGILLPECSSDIGLFHHPVPICRP